MMRLVYTDLAGQTGWDWSGPVPTGPTTDPDPLTGRFQITAYDLTAPNRDVAVAGARVRVSGHPRRCTSRAPLGPFTVTANDPESGIDWVFFQAKWPSGAVGQLAANLPRSRRRRG